MAERDRQGTRDGVAITERQLFNFCTKLARHKSIHIIFRKINKKSINIKAKIDRLQFRLTSVDTRF